MCSLRSTIRTLALAAIIGPTVAIGSAHADFFDAIGRIFGGDPSPVPVERSYQPNPSSFDDVDRELHPLGLTVRSRHVPKRQTVRRAKPPEKSVETVSLNPTENPSWYLDDPTLRRGDIVVLKGEVLVYEGSVSGRHSREEFSSLERSRLPSAEKQKLREMAGVLPPTQGAKAQPSQVAAAVAADQD